MVTQVSWMLMNAGMLCVATGRNRFGGLLFHAIACNGVSEMEVDDRFEAECDVAHGDKESKVIIRYTLCASGLMSLFLT